MFIQIIRTKVEPREQIQIILQELLICIKLNFYKIKRYDIKLTWKIKSTVLD